jgi:hypothetical protein
MAGAELAEQGHQIAAVAAAAILGYFPIVFHSPIQLRWLAVVVALLFIKAVIQAVKVARGAAHLDNKELLAARSLGVVVRNQRVETLVLLSMDKVLAQQLVRHLRAVTVVASGQVIGLAGAQVEAVITAAAAVQVVVLHQVQAAAALVTLAD